LRFDLLYGNTALKSAVCHAVSSRTFPSTCLIEGAAGSGKYTFAKLLAAALLCSGEERPCGICPHCLKIAKDIHPDVVTIDTGEEDIKIDVARKLRSDVFVRPNEADGKVFLIRHMQNMNIPSQNALLKILEEPPVGVYFILMTENKYALLDTVLSRCLKLNMSPLTKEEMDRALSEKGVTDPTVRGHLVETCEGNLGRALAQLDDDSEEVPAAIAEAVEAFADAMCEGKELSLCACTVSIEKMKKPELGRFLSELRLLMRNALVIQCGVCALSEDKTGKAEQLAARISREGLLKMSGLAAKCMDMTEVNVGTAHLLGYLTAGYYQVT